MKYIILYLLIGVLVQIFIRVIHIIKKWDTADSAKAVGHMFDENITLDDDDYNKIAYHPIYIMINVISWPINVGAAIVVFIWLARKYRGR